MSRYVHQIPFAAQGAFSWNRNAVHNGAPVRAGDPVDTSAFTPVRLRQMYDARIIVPAPFGDAPPPAYLNNGLGKADQLRAEIEREEAEAAQNSAKGESDAKPQPRPAPKPAAPRGADAKRTAAAAGKGGAKGVGSAKPAAKSPAKRAAARV